ncbi:Uncharacterised protein [Trueperella bialowiezensis]|uniref:Lipoprotein n=2 Tax=Trueperella bialowiezensis TaxID=312285 RepID=A0A448PD66_9ACTO|nr:Uncharacterised protein [Trueperella bialowiezensis]
MIVKRAITLVAAFFLAGCSASLKAPHMAPEREWNTIAISSTIERLDVGDGEVCPIIEPDTLVIFSDKASSSDDGATLDVDGIKLKVGSTFETSDLKPLEGGYDCGGNHYDSAVHVVFKGVTLLEAH